ncbi:SAM-dependent methyltransferase [Cronobacter phage Dev-CD-23823]|uniref:Uncharacterized protein n=1 Tax=Cronobacter phage Dev-CD-23823 TaxID=1712539 RepID=A0A0K8IXA3_9CAUD|nr:SAM-dependent methyltransferase [Cronobacter phage Dev-CD-23823]CUH74579.1 hypothetical protein [Cronobacter phage Dev-CD-23823]
MYQVFLSAFRADRDIDTNTMLSCELATILVQQGYTPEVCIGFYPENGGQTVTFEQSYSVRVQTWDEVVKLAAMVGGAYQQECVLAVNVVARMAASYVYLDGKEEPQGYFRSRTDVPDGARSQWRGSWWVISEEA